MTSARMGRGATAPQLRATLAAALLIACGGVTTGEPPERNGSGGAATGSGGSVAGTGGMTPSNGGSVSGSGGAMPSNGGSVSDTGGAPPSTGGVASSSGGAGPALPDCPNLAAGGTPCSQQFAHCGGPCSNSWQADNVCKIGAWVFVGVVACGPNASHAPQCKNSFSGGQLTPCCSSDKLDCAGKPDGYPGFGCTPGEGSFCSCTCAGGMSVCGC